MKKILSILLVLLVLVGCGSTNTNTNNNTPNNNDNTANNDIVEVVKISHKGIVYEITEEVSAEKEAKFGFAGSIREVVSEDALTEENNYFTSNSVEAGTEVFSDPGTEGVLIVATGDSEYTTFKVAE